MTLTLHDIKVWNTGEVIDLIVPSDTDETVDASVMTIAPGFEDPHVHFRDPGQTYKESMVSGCAAAASGGYTNVLIMPNTVPAMDGVSKIATSNEPDVPNKKSELFELDNWTYHFTPMGEMFACIDGEVCQIIGDEN